MLVIIGKSARKEEGEAGEPNAASSREAGDNVTITNKDSGLEPSFCGAEWEPGYANLLRV
jgi:hypothetical protein